MTNKDNEIKGLFGQHEAIRAQMKFLTESLKKMVIQPDSGEKGRDRIIEQIQSYRHTLRDLRAGVLDHIALDERIFGKRSSKVSNKSLAKEHEDIKQQIDYVIQVADEAIEHELSGAELNRRAAEITQIVDKIRELIRTHTAKEDRLLK